MVNERPIDSGVRNQFNCTNDSSAAKQNSEVRFGDGMRVRGVSDRFAEYGWVGVMMFECSPPERCESTPSC